MHIGKKSQELQSDFSFVSHGYASDLEPHTKVAQVWFKNIRLFLSTQSWKKKEKDTLSRSGLKIAK